jgi:hypothetical protein
MEEFNMDIELTIGQDVKYNLDGKIRTGSIEKFSKNKKTVVILTKQNDHIILPYNELEPLTNAKEVRNGYY